MRHRGTQVVHWCGGLWGQAHPCWVIPRRKRVVTVSLSVVWQAFSRGWEELAPMSTFPSIAESGLLPNCEPGSARSCRCWAGRQASSGSCRRCRPSPRRPSTATCSYPMMAVDQYEQATSRCPPTGHRPDAVRRQRGLRMYGELWAGRWPGRTPAPATGSPSPSSSAAPTCSTEPSHSWRPPTPTRTSGTTTRSSTRWRQGG